MQEIKCSGISKDLMGGVLCFQAYSKLFLASTVFSSQHLKLSLPVFLKSFLIVALL